MKLFRAAATLFFLFVCTHTSAQWQVPNHATPNGRGAGAIGFGHTGPCSAGIPLVGAGTTADPTCGPLNFGATGSVKGNLPISSFNGGINASASTFWNGAGAWIPINLPLTPDLFGAVCNGTTDDAVALQAWLNSLRDGGVGSFTQSQSLLGCATSVPLLLQPSTNNGPVQGPQILGSVKLIGLTGLGGSATAISSGTNLTLSSVAGTVHLGDTLSGGSAANNTHIISQTSGPTGGNGVYVTDQAAGIASSASIAIVSDLLRIWNPTAVTTSQNFYYPVFSTLDLSVPSSSVANCLSVRGYWGSVGKIFGSPCHVGDVVQFPGYSRLGISDQYESNPWLGDVTGINASGYVINNLIGLGATPRANNVRGTVSGSFASGLGGINATGSESISGSIAYTGSGWAVTINQPPAGGGVTVTSPHEVFMQGAGDIDCAQNGIWVAALSFGTITGHRMNLEPPNSFCGPVQWPLTAYAFGGGGGLVTGVVVKPYITIRPSYIIANGTIFDFKNDANITNLTVDATISDQTGTLAGAAFSSLYKNINASAAIRIIQNGNVIYDTITISVFSALPTCNSATSLGVRRIISDSNSTTYNAAAAGGGSSTIPVYCAGSSGWRVG